MKMKAFAIREVVETACNGEHSVRRTQSVRVEITWPEGFDLSPAEGYSMSGDWRIILLSPAEKTVDPDAF